MRPARSETTARRLSRQLTSRSVNLRPNPGMLPTFSSSISAAVSTPQDRSTAMRAAPILKRPASSIRNCSRYVSRCSASETGFSEGLQPRRALEPQDDPPLAREIHPRGLGPPVLNKGVPCCFGSREHSRELGVFLGRGSTLAHQEHHEWAADDKRPQGCTGVDSRDHVGGAETCEARCEGKNAPPSARGPRFIGRWSPVILAWQRPRRCRIGKLEIAGPQRLEIGDRRGGDARHEWGKAVVMRSPTTRQPLTDAVEKRF